MAFDLILGSASPRRFELLQQLNINAQVMTADIDESAKTGELASDYVSRLAAEKAQAVQLMVANDMANHTQSLPILAGDTIVVLAGELLGKPSSQQHAFTMWQGLSGRKHQVYSALALLNDGVLAQALSCTEVEFADISEAEMHDYWCSGEPADKAGGYAIQGYAARWIKSIHGSYSGVMGLPLYECAKLLQSAGIKAQA